MADLKSVRDDEGRPVARGVLTREEAYSDEHMSAASDIVFDQRTGVHIRSAIEC